MIQIALPPKQSVADALSATMLVRELLHIQLTIKFQTGDKMKMLNLPLLSLNKLNKLRESHGFQELLQLHQREDISYQTSELTTMLLTVLLLLPPLRLNSERNS